MSICQSVFKITYSCEHAWFLKKVKLNSTFGGQTIIFGKWTLEIGNVSVEVSIGDFSQSKKALLIQNPAEENPQITIEIQNNLVSLLRVVDI